MQYSFHDSHSMINPRPETLTQSRGGSKTIWFGILLFALSRTDAEDIAGDTRRCVKAADSAVAILACERQARERWQAAVNQLDQELQRLLSGQRKRDYATAQAAWESFRAAEFAMIDQTLGTRRDGLAGPFAEGAKAQFLRTRTEQLAGHLRAIRDLKSE
jgi:hypothetical protein